MNMCAAMRVIKRYYHTLRYLKPIQHYTRLKLLVKSRWYRQFPALTLKRLLAGYPAASIRNTIWPWEQQAEQALQVEQDWGQGDRSPMVDKVQALLRWEFNFLNKRVTFGSPENIGWHSHELSHLWRYQLHYFDYVRDLGKVCRLTGDNRYFRCFRQLVLSWINQNKAGTGDGWHPYTVSLRLVNWIYAYTLFDRALLQDTAFRDKLAAYIYAMAGYLAANLEYHVLGNHLLENARALIFAGLFFQGRQAKKWLAQGQKILWQQAQEQLLADGGHFELSPMYHTTVLGNYLECVQLLQANGLSVPAEVLDKVRAMLVFQKQILHPDGQNPLLNDSALQMGPDPQEVIQLGSRILKLALPDEPDLLSCTESGYYLMRNPAQGSFLIIDCGQPCPDYLPAHAHADLLSYEMSLFNQRFIVDSGIYEYTQGSNRDYFRSTMAHNTVTVNEQNQCDVWASFRVGRRGRPLSARLSRQGEAKVFQGSHDSYHRQFGVNHTRYIAEMADSCWLVVDELTLQRGIRHANQYSSYIHFHPDVSLENKTGSMAELKFCQHSVNVLFFSSHAYQLDLLQNSGPLRAYSANFGEYEAKLTLRMAVEAVQPVVFGYVITTEARPQVDLRFDSVEKYSIKLAGESGRWEFVQQRHYWLRYAVQSVNLFT